MRLAEYNVDTKEIRLLPIPAPGAKSINPNYSPHGRSMYFVSDRTGFNDVYRMDLATGALSQVTHTQTGVLGVTSLSPSLSVARTTGRVVFSVFDRQGNDIERLDGQATSGTPVSSTVTMAGGEPAAPNATPNATPNVAPNVPNAPNTA